MAAISSFGNGSFSNITQFSTTAPTPPGAVSSLSVESKTGGRISFTWPSPDDTGGVPITKYRLYANSQIAFENLQPTTRATAYGLIANSTYNFSVQAGNIINDIDTWGDMSSSFKFSTTTVTQPGPLILNPEPYKNATGGKVYLGWKAPLDTGGTSISSYSIFASCSSRPYFLAAKVSLKSEPLFASVTRLNASTAYEFFVLAINEIKSVKLPGNLSIAERSRVMRTTSDLSSWLSVGSVIAIQDAWFVVGDMSSAATGSIQLKYAHSAASIVGQPGGKLGQATTFSMLNTSAPTLPDRPPAPVVSISTGGMINMTLLSPEDTGGIPILGFSLYWNGEKLGEDYYLKTTSKANYLQIRAFVSVARLEPNTNYNIRPISKYASGGVSSTFAVETTSPTISSAPLELTVDLVTGGFVTLSWGAPADSGGIPLNSYSLSMASSKDGPFAEIYNDMARTTSIDLLNANTKYWVYVTAQNDEGKSPPSSILEFSTRSITPPSHPQDLQIVSVGYDSIKCTWSLPGDVGGDAIDSYIVAVMKTDDSNALAQTFTTKDSSMTLTQLTPATTYSISMTAMNTVRDVGSASFSRYATTSSAPNRLAAPRVGCVSHDSVELLWFSYSGASSYNIFRNGIKVVAGVLSPVAYDSQGLSAGTSYQYTVEAVTSAGLYSSDPVTVTTLDASYTATDAICRGNLGHISELNYANNVKKRWRIDPTTSYTYITLTFSSFMLECDHDYVEIIDATTKETWWKGGCGRTGRFVYQTGASIIIANEATTGGGLAMDNGKLTMESCIIADNTAKAAGGGLALSGTTTLTTMGTSIQRNVAVTNGGGIYASGVITVTFDKQASSQSSVVENSASTGAGMYFGNAQASLKGIRVEGGLASASGGGVAVVDSTVDWASVVIQANEAQEGGGLVLLNSRLTCKGSVLLTKNSAVDGGAVWVNKGTMDGFVDTQCLSNTASQRGGAFFVAGDATVRNVKLESHEADALQAWLAEEFG
ncbi:Titin [Phytophthora ramorum]|uniref:Titin n=1 Tax=Phytophthora ramorum TaxID=164328 RepID=UPI0030B424E7|nr:Titin [Phytophthora ramorum]